MASYYVLNCHKDETATQCIERCKLFGQLGAMAPLPADAYKGGIKQDRFGYTPALPGKNVIGEVTEYSRKTTYYIFTPIRTEQREQEYA